MDCVTDCLFVTRNTWSRKHEQSNEEKAVRALSVGSSGAQSDPNINSQERDRERALRRLGLFMRIEKPLITKT